MFSDGKNVRVVSDMLGRLLAIAYITKDEAKFIDHKLKLKMTMPVGGPRILDRLQHD
jgi:hypothetical protein